VQVDGCVFVCAEGGRELIGKSGFYTKAGGTHTHTLSLSLTKGEKKKKKEGETAGKWDLSVLVVWVLREGGKRGRVLRLILYGFKTGSECVGCFVLLAAVVVLIYMYIYSA